MTTPAQNTQPQTPLWTVEEVATYLHFAPETIRNMARNGVIPSLKVGKRVWRFHKEQIQAWLEQNRTPADG